MGKKAWTESRLGIISLGISAFTFLAICVSSGVSVQSCKQAEQAHLQAERSATAAEKSVTAAERSATAAEKSLKAKLAWRYYLSKTPTYIGSDDKDDVWFLKPGTAVPIRLPPAAVIDEWKSDNKGWYFGWLSIENAGPGNVESLSLSLDTSLDITYVSEKTIAVTGKQSDYGSPIDFDQPLGRGQRAVLLVATLREFPSEMHKMQVYALVNDAFGRDIQASITYEDSSLDEPKTEEIGLAPGEAYYLR